MGNAVRWTPEQFDAYKRRTAAEQPKVIAAAVQGKVVNQRPKMNKLESRYATEVLEPLKRAGEISDYGFERLKLELAPRTWYWPDFDLVLPDGRVVIHECKGFMREDAWIKLKVCAALYPHIPVYVIRRVKGRFTSDRVGPQL